MEIVKIILIGIVGILSYAYLKQLDSGLANLCAVSTGILIILTTVSYIITTVNFFKEFSYKSGISANLINLILKITVISYLTEFSVSLSEDVGVKSIGVKIEFASKIIIFVLSFPIIKNLFDIIFSFL